jgi:hypothetical protein
MQARGRRPGRNSVLVAGDFEVGITDRWRKEWDAEELYDTLQRLVDAGALDVQAARGVVTRIFKVDGHAANRVLAVLEGTPQHADVTACFEWVEQGAGRVEVTRAVRLPAPDES